MIYYKKIKNISPNLLLLSNNFKKKSSNEKYEFSINEKDKNGLIINVHSSIEYGEIGFDVKLYNKDSNFICKISLVGYLEIFIYFLILLDIITICIGYIFNITLILDNQLGLFIWLVISSLFCFKMYFKTKFFFKNLIFPIIPQLQHEKTTPTE